MDDRTRSELRKALLFGAATAALALVALAYRPALDAGFIWDDHVLAERDSAFRHVSIGKLFTSGFWPAGPLSDARAPYYRPVVLLSLRADLALGDEASGFHFTNLLLHLSACILVALVAVRSGARTGAAILAALVWGLAPRLTESVAWIAGRTDVLATVFGLAAVALSPALDASPHGRRRRGREVASACCLFLSLASKEVAIAFAVALVVARLQQTSWRRWSEWRASLAIEVGAPVALWLALRSVALGGRDTPMRDIGFSRRAGTVFETLERYVEMAFDALRPRTSIGMLGDLDRTRSVVGVVLALGLITALGYVLRRGGTGARLGAVVTATALAVVLHAIPVALAGAVAADRLLYVPLAGAAIALASTATASRRKGLLAASALLVAAFFFAATRARAADYADEGRFWVQAAANAHSGNPMPLRALAAYAESADEPELACRLLERARTRATATATVGLPSQRLTLEGLAACWIKLGRYEEARAVLEDLARANPAHGRVWMELGFAREHVLDFDGAAAAFAQALANDATLGGSIHRANADLARARALAPRFAGPARGAAAADPVAYADFLADIGHLPEAELASFAIAQDESQTLDRRLAAAQFVVRYGRLVRAEQLVRERPSLATPSVIERLGRHRSFQPLIPEVEQLLSR